MSEAVGSPAVNRAIDLILEVAMAQSESPPDLSRKMLLPKSTVTDLITTLSSEGVVVRDDDGLVSLGDRIAHIARGFSRGSTVLEHFYPACRSIVQLRGKTIALTVLVGADVVYLTTREGARPLPLTLKPGLRLPFWTTATGIALVAAQPDTAIERLIASGVPASPSGLSFDEALLWRAIAECRNTGIASNVGAEEMTLSSVAAAVLSNDQSVAAVGIIDANSVPGNENEFDAVQRLAADLSRRISTAK